MHLELGQVAEGVGELEAALALGVEDINAWHTRMDAEKLLAQVGSGSWLVCVVWWGGGDEWRGVQQEHTAAASQGLTPIS